jgi:feruloyl esterase
MRTRFALPCLLMAWLPLVSAASGALDCAALAKIALPHARIDAAAETAAGSFAPPYLQSGQPVPAVFRDAPTFCRVQATLAPSADSDIKVEVWLPLAGWSGRFRGQGNGGFAGFIDYDGLAAAVAQGDASASTDTGHHTNGAQWALKHPQKMLDYGFRAIHEMTVFAKSIVRHFYGEPEQRAYFASCSNGGRQALMEAQRYPADYDGILAGAPAANWTHLLANGLGVMQHALKSPGYIPPAKLPAITHAALAACDASDGLADGILGDPPRCHFDPGVLLCKGADADTCLTSAQVETLRVAYDGARDSQGKRVFPGLVPGAEDVRGSWADWVTGKEPGKSAGAFFVGNYFADMVYGRSNWQALGVDLDAALAQARLRTGYAMDAVDPDLRPYFAHGGKLILYHGWNDPAISPYATVDYFDAVNRAVGEHVADASLRLYMAPGMLHCAGGPGPNVFGQDEASSRSDPGHDIYAALVQWVEKGKAPDAIVATKFTDNDPAKPVAMTRPLCPWPHRARYDGHGDNAVADSFDCR